MKSTKLVSLATIAALLLAGVPALANVPKAAGGDTGIKPVAGDKGVKPAAGDKGIKPAAGDKAAPVKAPDLSENLFPIEFIVKAGPQIGLGETTFAEIRSIMQETNPKLNDAQLALRTDTMALNDLLKQDHPDTPTCLAALDKVLDDERAVKRINMEAALKVRGLLSPDQFAKLKELRDQQVASKGGGGGGSPS